MTRAKDISKIITDANFIGDITASSFNGGQIGGRRNIIINGAMQVAQRSNSAVAVSNNSNEGYQTVDRVNFGFGNNAGGACNISQDTTVPSGLGFSNSYKVDVTTADTSIASTHQIFFRTILEARDIRNSGWNYTDSTGNSKITCSFYARSNKAGTYCFSFRSVDASGSMYYVKEFTLVADTWKRVIITIPSNSSLVFDDDTNAGAVLAISLQAGSDRDNATDDTWNTSDSSLATSNQVNFFDDTANNFFLTGWQLEVGSQATPFEHRSYGEELTLCQRYFHQNTFLDNKVVSAGGAVNSSTIAVCAGMPHPVIMRASPTGSVSNGTHFEVRHKNITTQSTSVVVSGSSRSSYFQASVASGLTTGQGCFIRSSNDSCTLAFDAEL